VVSVDVRTLPDADRSATIKNRPGKINSPGRQVAEPDLAAG